MKMKLIFTLFLLTGFFNAYSQSHSYFNYEDCTHFDFQESSNDCHFVKELNKAAQESYDLRSEQYFVTRYINSSNNEIVGYDIENLNPQFDIEGRNGDFLEIKFSKKLERYLVELRNNHFGKIEILDFWD